MAQSLPTSHVSRTEEADEENNDLMASAPNLWMPRAVVKRNRRTATAIWVVMLVAFIVYIVYIMLDTLDARSHPAAHVRIKQEHYKFPDISVCAIPGEGCYSFDTYCFHPNVSSIWMSYNYGFLEDELELDEKSRLIEKNFPHCKVLPLSKLTVNETGVDNEDINHFVVGVVTGYPTNHHPEHPFVDDSSQDRCVIRRGTWYELRSEGNSTSTNTRSLRLFFIDVDADMEEMRKEVVDGDIPYGVITAKTNESLEVPRSSVLISMTEFRPIGPNGQKLERERTYTQRTTSATLVSNWTGDPVSELAVLDAELLIPKFEFMVIEEVDPVDVWAIIGAIGGVWQIVCVGFGLFFVFSVKQPPDLKIRNFRKAMAKPLAVGKIMTQSVSRHSQDVEIDAGDEDLPDGWVKKQRSNGSVYYLHVPTGTSQDRCPSPLEATRAGHGRIQPAHDPRASGSLTVATTNDTTAGVPVQAGELPKGWVMRKDHEGRTYYVDTENQTTQWDPPVVPGTSWDAPAPQANSGVGHEGISSEPPQGLVRGAPVADPPSKTDGGTSSSKRRANRRVPFIREVSRPRRRVSSQQQQETGDDEPSVTPAPSGGTLSYPSGGRGDSSAASAGRRKGAHAGPSMR